jgi:hypothetical protein
MRQHLLQHLARQVLSSSVAALMLTAVHIVPAHNVLIGSKVITAQPAACSL